MDKQQIAHILEKEIAERKSELDAMTSENEEQNHHIICDAGMHPGNFLREGTARNRIQQAGGPDRPVPEQSHADNR